jgi:hypothetical protein
MLVNGASIFRFFFLFLSLQASSILFRQPHKQTSTRFFRFVLTLDFRRQQETISWIWTIHRSTILDTDKTM